MRKAVTSMRVRQAEASPEPAPKMNSMIAVALLCPRNEPIETEEDVERLFRARVEKTSEPGMLKLLELAKAQMMGEVGSLCGNIGKAVKPVKQPVVLAMPQARQRVTSGEIPQAEGMPEAKAVPVAMPEAMPEAAPAANDIVGEIRKIFAEGFEEKQGNYLTFGDIFEVFSKCRGTVTDQDQRQFRFYCKALFLEQWPNARHCVHAKKRSYVNVCVKN